MLHKKSHGGGCIADYARNTRRENGVINVRNLVSKLIREEIVILIITIIIIITRPQWPKGDR